MIEAVVFDLDGVLVDSEPVWEHVRGALGGGGGAPVGGGGGGVRGARGPPHAQQRLMGMSTPEWARYLSEDLGIGLPPEQVARLVIRAMAGQYQHNLPLLPGAVDAVRRMADRWPLGLASSSPPALIHTVLTTAAIAPLFKAAVSTEEVAQGKPAPDVYLTVASRLGVDPDRAVAVEDSSNGLRSAAAAGTHVVAVPRPEYPPAADALAQAQATLHDLDELTVDLVAGLG